MDNTVTLVAAAIVLFVLIILLSFLRNQFIAKSGEINVRQAADAQDEGVGGVRRAVAVRNRLGLRNRAGNRQHVQEEGQMAEAEVDVDENEGGTLLDLGDMKVGKKKLAKLEAKAERKAAREAELKEREERKAIEVEKEKERKLLEELEEKQEKEREEQLKKEAEEKIRKEHEEYLKMKAAFSIEEQGFEAEEDAAQENLLQKFVEYVKETKIVFLEELAAQFQLKTQDAIDRLHKLVEEDVLTGVIDDRGKFIYISHEEMEAVGKFIRQRGRVSLADLAENSNQLIHLGPQVV
uniref:DDRGK domain-containing protein 1 n=1 Tax=Scapholeberis mucronata TaxID=202097 RepID=A0A4Y7NN82_9CRUS|nr:EOG090X0N9E [Scapholeberis mucronata]SVE94044.1 EOG090X0N9E [Scapholeberis mucronata]